jgi:hypothetical protein
MNGDLVEIRGGRPSDRLLEIEPNPKHRKEYFADLVAFYLVLKIEVQPISPKRRFFLLIAMITLFDSFYMLESKESETHPDPIKRLFCLSDHFYGVAITELINQSYENSAVMLKALEMMGSINSSEPLIGEYFDRTMKIMAGWLKDK